MNKLSAALLTLLSAMSLQAQPRLSLPQLIPGNDDYLRVQNLKNARWEKDGFVYDKDGEKDPKHGQETPGTASADGLWTAVNEGSRLYVQRLGDNAGETARQEVSDTTDPDIVWGQSVHRNEFGISGGLFWSPSGHRLAFYRMDQTMVGRYPLVETDAREAEVKWVRYPMAGMKSHEVTLGIYDPDTRQTVWLRTADQDPDPEHYLTCVTWRPDGSQVIVAELNRLQNHLKVNVYDAATGDYVKTLFEEKNDRYVEPEAPLFFLDNDRYVWQSERDGWNHLYLYNINKENAAPVQLTEGDWMVTRLLAKSPKADKLYFTATRDGYTQNNLYEVSVRSRKIRRLTTEDGWHNVEMSPNCRRFYDAWSNHETPRVCQLVDTRSLKKRVLLTAPNPYDGYQVPQITSGTCKAADGETELRWRMVLPTDFDSTRRYPAVVYLYNGPHAQMVIDSWLWSVRGWDIHMANLGYVVFTIDGRGSEHRGLAFEQAIWHRLGEVEGQDQMAGIREVLLTRPYIDAERIGIHGWSYGGFMTTWMMLHYPETFKVGVAGGPVLDWSRYEVMYGERYMGTPDGNPDGYAANTLIDQAGNLRGRLLLIHDDQDDTVVPQMSVQFLKNAVGAGTHPDFMLYPNHPHNVRGKDRVHLHETITRYFEDFLKQ